MGIYRVRYVAGPALVNGQNIGGMFIPQSTELEADSRVDAYLQVYHHLSAHGDVTVASRSNGHPLGFSSEELHEVGAAGVPFEDGVPRNGFQIEEIAQQE
jgi:hypothetical protein